MHYHDAHRRRLESAATTSGFHAFGCGSTAGYSGLAYWLRFKPGFIDQAPSSGKLVTPPPWTWRWDGQWLDAEFEYVDMALEASDNKLRSDQGF